jgi:hypothetical protein
LRPQLTASTLVAAVVQVRALEQLDADEWVQRYAWYTLSTYGWLGERFRCA